jgi:DEAD/DEAH box helicase domain-containing protein
LYWCSDTQDKHKRRGQDPGTAVPYECPSCGEDYFFRDRPHRLSPIRSFRAGFAKTTQLLATELFDLLGLEGQSGSPKLVSFSDSRQDAANAALDIERRHHEDLRRQLLVRTAREQLDGRPSQDTLDEEINRLKQESETALRENNFARRQELGSRLTTLESQRSEPSDPIIPLRDIMECVADAKSFQGRRGDREPLKPFLKTFVKLGVHPTDPAGIRKFKLGGDNDRRNAPWDFLFHIPDGCADNIDWYDSDRAQEQSHLDDARKRLVETAQRGVVEIVFHKSYFALEETGMGYPCVRRGQKTESEFDELNAFLRVLGDAYRFDDSPWGASPKGWQSAQDVSGRVKQLGQSLWPDSHEYDTRIETILRRLAAEGHTGGLISGSYLCIYLVEEDSPYWRCGQCRRSHLHRGVGLCAWCRQPLPNAPTGTAGELRQASFLAKRIERPGAAAFRLHCEELTGQTDRPADRQRKFRGILLPSANSDGDLPRPLYREAVQLLAKSRPCRSSRSGLLTGCDGVSK